MSSPWTGDDEHDQLLAIHPRLVAMVEFLDSLATRRKYLHEFERPLRHFAHAMTTALADFNPDPLAEVTVAWLQRARELQVVWEARRATWAAENGMPEPTPPKLPPAECEVCGLYVGPLVWKCPDCEHINDAAL